MAYQEIELINFSLPEIMAERDRARKPSRLSRAIRRTFSARRGSLPVYPVTQMVELIPFRGMTWLIFHLTAQIVV
jgi:hypothetical protein